MKGVAALAVFALVLALLALAVMLLWNALVPELFHGRTLQYWQALGLLLLSRILLGGLRGRGWHGHWRQRMWRERWENMTPEERERLREHFQQRCGRRAAASTQTAASSPDS
jgi:ABC-type multidrug transport system fused ATPase/permease subunit